MGNLAIRVNGLAKSYQIAGKREAYSTIRDSISQVVSTPFRRAANLLRGQSSGASDLNQTFWALNDLSFDVEHGEVLGIIGRNGAGKSTLLKILSRITEPTKGYADLYGRIGALLEVGTGFHPELTGRENIYLNGAILGMKRAEIKRKFDEIVAFAEVEQFIDTPVKHYSSGMGLRLGFAVAAHLEPEILIVDEVLAVGDTSFQRKCLGKMSAVASEGRTVLFVSHNMAAVANLCTRGIVLHKGNIYSAGTVQDVVKDYMLLAGDQSEAQGEYDLRNHPTRRRDSIPILEAITFLNDQGVPQSFYTSGETISFVFTINPPEPLKSPHFGIGVDDLLGTRLFSLVSGLSPTGIDLPPIEGRCQVVCRLKDLPLSRGRYVLSLSVGTKERTLMDALDNAVSFEVEGGDYHGVGKLTSAGLGKFLVRADWNVLDSVKG